MPIHGRRFEGGSVVTQAPPPLGDGGSGSTGSGGSTLSAGATGAGSLKIAMAAVLSSITSNIPARVRFYGTAATRDADKNRKIGIKASAAAGVQFEGLFNTNNETIITSPLAVLQNNDNPQVSNIYYNITNLTNGPASVVLTLIVNAYK